MDIDSRSAELASNLARVRSSITDACVSSGRPADAVSLIVVTKTWPASDVKRLADLGVTDVAENRDQEAAAKVAACAGIAIRWHFVGQLQTNKCHSVVRYSRVIHSVDRSKLVTALSRAAAAESAELVTCLVQVNLDGRDSAVSGPAGRGGVDIPAAPGLADQIAGSKGLTLGGVMGVAPIGGDMARAFDQLVQVSMAIRRDHPAACMVSAGMSSDFAVAIAAGATHVRMGTAVLGHRPHLR